MSNTEKTQEKNEVKKEQQKSEIEIHFTNGGMVIAFYRETMTSEEFNAVIRLNRIFESAYRKGFRFKATITNQLDLPFNP